MSTPATTRHVLKILGGVIAAAFAIAAIVFGVSYLLLLIGAFLIRRRQ